MGQEGGRIGDANVRSIITPLFRSDPLVLIKPDLRSCPIVTTGAYPGAREQINKGGKGTNGRREQRDKKTTSN